MNTKKARLNLHKLLSKSTVRLVLATSLDGRIAFANGGKGDLGSKGDREVLEKALAWCDATLMGSQTLRVHENTCLIHNNKLIEERVNENRSPQPLSIIVSRNTSFSDALEFFKQPVNRAILSPHPTQIEHFKYQFLIEESWSKTIKNLHEKGYSKILLLGGIKLIRSFLEEDQIDELQLTLTPRILGGQYSWTAPDMKNIPLQLTKLNAWELESLEALESNEVMIKYLRSKS